MSEQDSYHNRILHNNGYLTRKQYDQARARNLALLGNWQTYTGPGLGNAYASGLLHPPPSFSEGFYLCWQRAIEAGWCARDHGHNPKQVFISSFGYEDEHHGQLINWQLYYKRNTKRFTWNDVTIVSREQLEQTYNSLKPNQFMLVSLFLEFPLIGKNGLSCTHYLSLEKIDFQTEKAVLAGDLRPFGLREYKIVVDLDVLVDLLQTTLNSKIPDELLPVTKDDSDKQDNKIKSNAQIITLTKMTRCKTRRPSYSTKLDLPSILKRRRIILRCHGSPSRSRALREFPIR